MLLHHLNEEYKADPSRFPCPPEELLINAERNENGDRILYLGGNEKSDRDDLYIESGSGEQSLPRSDIKKKGEDILQFHP
jgi:hypothetical protein